MYSKSAQCSQVVSVPIGLLELGWPWKTPKIIQNKKKKKPFLNFFGLSHVEQGRSHTIGTAGMA
jgi:hypothetical protein